MNDQVAKTGAIITGGATLVSGTAAVWNAAAALTAHKYNISHKIDLKVWENVHNPILQEEIIHKNSFGFKFAKQFLNFNNSLRSSVGLNKLNDCDVRGIGKPLSLSIRAGVLVIATVILSFATAYFWNKSKVDPTPPVQ